MKSEIKHRMTRRLNGWDYCQRAIYSITVTLADRSRPWLGKLNTLAVDTLAKNGEEQDGEARGGEARDGEADTRAKSTLAVSTLAKNGEEQDGEARGGAARDVACTVAAHSCNAFITPTPFGEAMVAALKDMPRLYPQVRLIEWQVMPEHFHFIIFVVSPLPKPLGALIRGFKAGAAKRWLALMRQPSAHECASSEPPRWADGFQDTILLREGQLRAEIAYLHDNPRRLAEKRANPELFRRVAAVSLPLDGGRLIGRFEAMGNLSLLNRPLVQVQCSRRYFAYRRVPKSGPGSGPESGPIMARHGTSHGTGGLKIARDSAGNPIIEHADPEYEAIKESVFAAASHGAVVISPCISDGEREIAREAMNRGFRLVAMRNMGFAPIQKPTGRLFDICAQGRLLLLAPAAWPYSTQEKPMTRFDATALNRICQWLAGEDAVEVNYHGMTPFDIDRLAEDAVLASAP